MGIYTAGVFLFGGNEMENEKKPKVCLFCTGQCEPSQKASRRPAAAASILLRLLIRPAWIPFVKNEEAYYDRHRVSTLVEKNLI